MAGDKIWNQPPGTTGEGFKCSICEKSFEQRSSRDRHLRRCRQKQLTGIIPRKKSCTLCTQAKTRCDLRTPACSRCKTKGLDCRYYSSTTPVPPPALSPAPREENSLPTPATTDPEYIDDTEDIAFDTSLGDVAIIDWGEISSNLLDWVPMFGLTGTVEQVATEPRTPQNLAPRIRTLDQFRSVGQPSRLVSVESFIEMRHRLTHLPLSVTSASRFDQYNFINLVIKEYPKMIVGGEILPPFIHSSSLMPGKISEALANCKGLVEMYKTMTPENHAFVMKTIAQEHERLLQQYASLNDSEMLSSLQAALIYGLIRHFEGDPLMDRPLLMRIETLAFNVGLGGLMARGEIEGVRPAWDEWILAESKRRSLLTLYIFDATFHHSRRLQTLTSYELGELPLPAIRVLWEGADRAIWEQGYEKYLTSLKGEKLPRVQDAWGTSNVTFGEWYAGMDTFGVTVLALCQSCVGKINCTA